MKSMIKLELKRAFTSRGLLLSLAIGCLIAVIHVIFNVVPAARDLNGYMALNLPMSDPAWLYSYWMGGNGNDVEGYLFYLILPILATLPFADTFFTDCRGGFVKNVCIRVRRGRYYFAKYLATVLSGGAAVVLPLALNFLLSCLLLPSLAQQAAASFSGICDISPFSGLYYTLPLVYVLIYLVIDFLFAGLIASLALVTSQVVENRFLVLLSPFLIYLFVFSLCNLIGEVSWEPFNFLQPSYPYGSIGVMLAELLLLLLPGVVFFLIKGPRDDIY